jgi:hypothetical protein
MKRDMRSLEYKIVPMEKQDDGWSRYNGPESGWCWIRITEGSGDELGCGVTMMGPYLVSDAKTYIDKIRKTIEDKDVKWWQRLYSVLLR